MSLISESLSCCGIRDSPNRNLNCCSSREPLGILLKTEILVKVSHGKNDPFRALYCINRFELSEVTLSCVEWCIHFGNATCLLQVSITQIHHLLAQAELA